MDKIKQGAYNLLRRSERLFKTDMVYLAKGGFWLTANQAFTVAAGFILSIVYANFISPTLYGIFKYALSFAAILSVFSLPGLNTSYAQAVARGHEGNLDEVIKKKLVSGLLGACVGMVIATYYFLKSNVLLGSLFAITACFVPTWNLFGITDFYLQGKKLFRQSTIYSAVESVCTMTIISATLLLTHSAIYLAIAYFSSWSLIQLIIYHHVKKTLLPNREKEDGIISYGMHLTFISIIPTISQHIDRILVFQFLGPVQLAGYNFVTIIPDQLRSYFKNIQSIAAPVLVTTQTQKLWSRIRQKIFLLTSGLILFTTLYIVSAPKLFEILFPKYAMFDHYSQWYALTIVFSAVTLPFLALQAKEKKLALYQFNTVKSIFQIIFLIVLIIPWGLGGVIASRILTESLALLLGSTLVRKHLS